MGFPSRASLALAAGALLIGFTLGACGLGPQSEGPTHGIRDPLVAARVNGRPIYIEDVRTYAVSHGMARDGADLSVNSDAFENALDALIEVRLFALEAEARGLDRQPEVRRALEATRDEVLARAIYEEIDARANDDQALQRAYNQAAPRLGQGRSVHLRHIQFATKDEAEAAKRRLARGDRFEVLAYELSTDRATAADGGDWGVGAISDLVSGLREEVLRTEVGHVAGPIQIGDTWHLIRVEEISDSGPPTLESLRPRLVTYLQWEENRRLYERLERNARIERIRQADTGVAPSGDVTAPADSPTPVDQQTATTVPARPGQQSPNPFTFPMGPGGV